MVQLAQAYNVEDMSEKRQSFDPLPPATYVSMVTASDEKKTAAGGTMIVLQHTVQEGDYAGRIVFENLNIKNANPKAEKMAADALGELCHAIKLTGELKDTEQLHNKRYQMTLKVKPASEYDYTDPETGVVSKRMGNAQNEIVKVLPIGAKAPEQKAEKKVADSAPAANADAPKGKTPAWKQKK